MSRQRNSEIVSAKVRETGLLVTIRGSKTDQERAGATIAIAGSSARPGRIGRSVATTPAAVILFVACGLLGRWSEQGG